MFELIMCNYAGSTLSVVLTGIPVVITGEVINSGYEDIIALRQKGGNKVFIAANLIAFVF